MWVTKHKTQAFGLLIERGALSANMVVPIVTNGLKSLIFCLAKRLFTMKDLLIIRKFPSTSGL
jgi:hypothetical protein